MLPAQGYAIDGPASGFRPFEFTRRDPGPRDVVIDILYCGICHSDIHQARSEWGPSLYPMVPGHEIVGRVAGVGREVDRFRTGDVAGVGCFVDSCRTCPSCLEGVEQFCEEHLSLTYNSTEQDRKTPTYGGYSNRIVVDEQYVLCVPPELEPASAAPLLCAGITTYSPLRAWGAGPGTRVAVMGLGGLGHMAVRLARSMGSDVTVLSSSPEKEGDARRLGAGAFVLTSGEGQRPRLAGSFDLIINTVSAAHDLDAFLEMLRRDGTMVVVGAPPEASRINVFSLIRWRRRIAGSLIGGIRQTQEMLDYCARHGIASEVEIIPVQQIGEAYERAVRGEVRYRFVIDMASLGDQPTM